jgi:hypothetical protein
MKTGLSVVFFIVLLLTGQALAQVPAPVTNTDFSKETENPVTREITLPLRYQGDFLDGADRLTKSTFELDQAVVPFRLNDDWSLITRTKLPAEALPPKKTGDFWADGLSNGYTTFFLSPEHGRGFYWGAGSVLYYPATNSMLGTTKMGLGPFRGFHTRGRGSVGHRSRRQQHLDVWRRSGQQRHQPNAAQPDYRLSFRRWLGDQLVAGDHRKLDRQRQQVDGAGRRRREQGRSVR